MTAEKKYELMTIFIPTLTEKEVEKELDNIKKMITKQGTIVHEQIWGKRDLYYKIKGQEKGIYAILHFTTEDSIAALSQELKLMNHILRFLLIKLPKNYEVKPFVMLEKTEKKEVKEEEKKTTKSTKSAKRTSTKEKKEEKKIIYEEIVREEEKEIPQASDRKKKKSSFDEKIDEIIENLDNL
jgi:small subunit ribosomal protein S6